MKTATVLVIGGPLVVSSRSWAIRSKAALASRRPSPEHQEDPGDLRARLAKIVVPRVAVLAVYAKIFVVHIAPGVAVLAWQSTLRSSSSSVDIVAPCFRCHTATTDPATRRRLVYEKSYDNLMIDLI